MTKPLLPLVLLLILPILLTSSSASPSRIILDFILQKFTTGFAHPFNIAFLPNVSISPNPGSKNPDLISALPGQPKGITFQQYSGYIPVDEAAGRFFFYYFAEAQASTSKTPLFVWINGGPGCSSIGSGAFLEHGPLLVAPGGKTLLESTYAWNNFAHVLYVDSPVGTGFSYSDTPNDYQSYNDSSVASDNLRFLVNWLARFPEHAGRKIYLAGEGYAGNYIPQLAQLILNRNHAKKNPTINLKSIILQNAVIDADEDRWGFFDSLWSHGMLSQKMYDDIEKHCIKNSLSEKCVSVSEAVAKSVLPLYLFDLTASVCNFKNSTAPRYPVDEYYECQEKDVATYLRSPEVQKALHVNPKKVPKEWVQCNRDVEKGYIEITNSTLPIMKSLLSNNVSVLAYSGDADASIPPMSSRLSTRKLKFWKSNPWHVWYPTRIDNGGFAEGYSEGISFATVRGAGHFVAKAKGPQLQYLITIFMNGTLPNVTFPIIDTPDAQFK